MIELRKSDDRGHATHGWLDSRHSFSFADYYDPAQMGFGPLRVINEDRVAPGKGFGSHGHRDMEIISYILEGSLAHKDSLGHSGVISPGDVQRMSAGRGIMHAEYNGSQDSPVHFLQIWIEPNVHGIPPGYEERRFEPAEKRGRLRLLASPDGSDGSVTIHQDARLYAGQFDAGESATAVIDSTRRGYLHVARGEITVNDIRLGAGDAIRLTGGGSLSLYEGMLAEVLLFDLP